MSGRTDPKLARHNPRNLMKDKDTQTDCQKEA